MSFINNEFTWAGLASKKMLLFDQIDMETISRVFFFFLNGNIKSLR